MENEKLVLKTISNIISNKYIVPSYQRGYRWTVQNVLDLLNDINSFEPKKNTDDFYCLQPVVVRNNSDKLELIDGQQRLTTIYIILSILDKEKLEIDYQTRKTSSFFLQKIIPKQNKIEYNDFKDEFNVKNIQKFIDKKWGNYIKNNSNLNNIDNYHFYGAYITAKLWIDKNGEKFYKKLLNKTKVIWYEISGEQNTDSRDIFARLNSGKIPLTNAELIKALFLSKKAESNTETLILQSEIATQWDMIEYSLQEEAFWSFIHPEKYSNPTKIEFIFDIITKKPENEKQDENFTFRKFDEKLKENSIKEVWNEIFSNFMIFKEWFDNQELYHLIGILTANNEKITTILKEYKHKNKKEFINWLKKENLKNIFEENFKEIIKEDIKNIKVEIGKFISDFSYDENYNSIRYLLLLHNILTIEAEGKNQRFEFERYNNLKWSIEHIHAQNSENFGDDKKKWLEWFKEAKEIFNSISNKNFNEEINKIIDELKDENKKFDEIADKAILLFNKIIIFFQGESIETTHELSNLALLDRDTNSSLNNSIFPKKKEKIFEKINTTFIPICTQRVFTKFYSKSITQMYFWGKQDREAYFEDIVEKISNFITLKN